MPAYCEIEVKYLQLLFELDKTVQLRDLPVQRICQHYFSGSRIKELLLPNLRKRLPQVLIPEGPDYKNGRIRCAEQADRMIYSLTVKGPRHGGYDRSEYEIEIEEALYTELLQQADCGSVSKLRYALQGFLLKGTERIPAVADIDYLESAAGRAVIYDNLPQFVIIEVEVENLEETCLLEQREHTFECLHKAVPIAALPPEDQKYMHMRHYARHGVDDAAQQVLNRVLKG